MERQAVIYARVSSVGDRQNTERQVHDLEKYAIHNGMVINRVFEEHISGAKKNTERVVLQECLQYAKENGIKEILCSELSRFGRAVFEVLESVKWCCDNGINVYFQKEQMNLFLNGRQNPYVAIVIAVLGSCAEMERESIAFRLNSGRKRAIEKGVRMGRPSGSSKTVEAKKEQYAEAIRLLKKGYSLNDVVHLCRDKNIKVSLSTVKRLKKEFC